jgi:hypothetical protein
MPIILMGDWLAPSRPPDPASASAHPRAITKERGGDGWAGAGAGAGATSVIRARASDTSTVQYMLASIEFSLPLKPFLFSASIQQ